jgi:hypothetical protein
MRLAARRPTRSSRSTGADGKASPYPAESPRTMAQDDSGRVDIADVDVIAPNFKKRLSGVTLDHYPARSRPARARLPHRDAEPRRWLARKPSAYPLPRSFAPVEKARPPIPPRLACAPQHRNAAGDHHARCPAHAAEDRLHLRFATRPYALDEVPRRPHGSRHFDQPPHRLLSRVREHGRDARHRSGALPTRARQGRSSSRSRSRPRLSPCRLFRPHPPPEGHGCFRRCDDRAPASQPWLARRHRRPHDSRASGLRAGASRPAPNRPALPIASSSSASIPISNAGTARLISSSLPSAGKASA